MGIFRFLLRRRRPKLPSILNELSVQLAVNQLSAILRNTSDPRFLIETAATSLGIPEDSLIRRIAERTGIPSVSALAPMHPAVLQRYSNLNELERAGAALITTPTQLLGVTCADPQLCEGLYAKLPAIPIYLSSWSNIRRCIEGSRGAGPRVSTNSPAQPSGSRPQSTASSQSFSPALAPESSPAVSQKPISQKQVSPNEATAQSSAISNLFLGLVSQLAPYQVTEAEIDYSAASLRYNFRTPQGKRGSGDINAAVRSELQATLEKSLQAYLPVIQIGGLVVRVGRDSAGERHHLNWGPEPRAIEPIVEAARPIVKSKPTVAESIAGLKPDSLDDDRPTILVIDDNEQFGNVLSMLFKKHSFNVHYASNAARAFDLLQAGLKPDIFVCDVHMPQMNGFSFLKNLRAQDQITPVLMLTSDEEDDTQVQLLGEGADAFVAKSEHPNILFAHVKRLLAKANARKAA